MHRFGLEGARAQSAFDSPGSRVAASSLVATATGPRSLTKTRVAILAAAFFLLAGWAGACCVTWGQGAAYDQIPASPALSADKKQQNDLKGLVSRMLSGSEPLDPNKAKFEGWYRAFVFPQMTHADKLGQIAETRENFLKELVNAKSEPARQLAVRVALEEMKKIAAGNYHPGARYNAMLILGELNQTEAVLTPATSARPPRPLPAALQAMMEEWRKPNVTDALTVACLLGARRHVDLDRMLPADQKMDPAVKKEIYDRSMALLQSDAPETRKPLAHAYLKMIATDILAYVGNPGANGETVAALDAVIDDPTAPDFLKAAAISAIGEMNLPESYADQAPTLMRSFAEASFGFLLHEIEALNAEKQYRIDFATRPIQGGAAGAGYGSEMMGSGYPGAGMEMSGEYGGYPGSGMIDPTKPPKPPRGPLADERDYVLENSRRRLKTYLVDTQRALRGRDPRVPAGLSKVATKPEDQELLKTLDDELDEVIDSMQDPELTIVQLIEGLTARSAAMQTSLGVTPPADPAETAEATAGTPAETEPAGDAATDPDADPAAGPPAGGARGPGGRGPGARGPGAAGPNGPGARGPGARGPGARGPGAGPAGEGDPAEGVDPAAPAAGEAPAEAAPAGEAPAEATPAP